MTRVPYYRDNSVRQNLLHEFTLATLNPNAKRNITILSKTPEEHRDNLLYLIRFIFQFANGYETLEEALAHKDDDEMKPLKNLIMNYPRGKEYDRTTTPHGIFLVGYENDIIISDMGVILTIVYNKLDFDTDYLKIFKLVSEAQERRGSKTRQKEFDRINALLTERKAISIKE